MVLFYLFSMQPFSLFEYFFFFSLNFWHNFCLIRTFSADLSNFCCWNVLLCFVLFGFRRWKFTTWKIALSCKFCGRQQFTRIIQIFNVFSFRMRCVWVYSCMVFDCVQFLYEYRWNGVCMFVCVLIFLFFTFISIAVEQWNLIVLVDFVICFT